MDPSKDVDYKEIQRSAHIVASISMAAVRQNLSGFDAQVQARNDALAIAQASAEAAAPPPPPPVATQFADKMEAQPMPLDPGIPLQAPVGGDGGNSGILVVTTGIQNGVASSCNFYADANPVPL